MTVFFVSPCTISGLLAIENPTQVIFCISFQNVDLLQETCTFSENGNNHTDVAMKSIFFQFSYETIVMLPISRQIDINLNRYV